MQSEIDEQVQEENFWSSG